MKSIGVGVIGAVLLVVVLLVVVVGGFQATKSATSAAQGAGGAGGLGLKGGEVPKQYRAMIEKGGQVCAQVSAPHLAAQLEQESGWNPTATSPVGAQGLAQFMPGTWPAYQQDANGNGTASPTDPADAIDAQARYMCDLSKQIAPIAKRIGTPVIELAWAAYNAGPGAVQQYGGIPPFAETQNYVKILREGTRKYSAGPAAGAGVKASGKWAPPLAREHMIPTSGFGGRDSPCAGCSSNHQGQDFGAPEGADIFAACDGVVDFAGQMSGYGNITFIYCGRGVRTGYAHQSQLGVQQGQKVSRGDVIGKVGSTGVGTAAHLHFEVRTGATEGEGGLSGTATDPAAFMAKQGIAW